LALAKGLPLDCGGPFFFESDSQLIVKIYAKYPRKLSNQTNYFYGDQANPYFMNHLRVPFCILLFLLSIFYIQTSHAQSEETMLAEVVAIYDNTLTPTNQARQQADPQKVMDSIRDVSETAMERLKILKLSTNPSMAKNARYFYMIMKYNYSIGYNTIGQFQMAIKYHKELEEDMRYFDASQFPLQYNKNGTNYVIRYDNFVQSRCKYFVSFGEMMYTAYDYAKSLEYTRMAIPMLNDGWLSYVCYYYGIHAKVSLNQYDNECVQFCSRQLTSYYNLSSSNIDTIKTHSYDTYRMATNNLDIALEKGPLNAASYADLTSSIQILKYYLDPFKEQDAAQRSRNKFILLRWYHEAVMSEYATKEVVKSAMAFADSYADPSSNDKADWLQRFEKLTLDCADYQWLIDQYARVSDTANTLRLMPSLTSCKDQEAKAAAQAEEDRKKADKQMMKRQKNSNRMPLFFVGLNFVPFLYTPRDIGLALNIGGSHMVTEFSYLKVNSKPENYFDLSLKNVNDVPEHRWNGYFAHINFKFPTDDWNNGRSRSYAGLLLAYNERTFDPFEVLVTPVSGAPIYTRMASPTSKQYSGMVNFGYMGVAGFGVDVFMGLGAAYNQFDGQIAEYNQEDYTLSDAMLEHRPTSYWSFTMRMGVAIGLGFAKE
jgi:hypothetical protein